MVFIIALAVMLICLNQCRSAMKETNEHKSNDAALFFHIAVILGFAGFTFSDACPEGGPVEMLIGYAVGAAIFILTHRKKKTK